MVEETNSSIEEADPSYSESDLESEACEGNDLVSVEDEPEGNEDLISILQSALEICYDQKTKGNRRFLREFAESLTSAQKLVDEVAALQNRRSMPWTWAKYKHPATMYYR